MKSVCIFCGSKSGIRKEYADNARSLGELFVKNNIAMIYGGATNGIMGIIADTMMHHGGNVIGVIPTIIADRELAHNNISTLHVVESMSERKTKMIELADAFITLPGGVGTMDEMFEVLAFTHLGVNEKLVGVLNVNGFYDSMLAFIDHAVAEEFVPAHVKNQIVVDADPKQLLTKMGLA
ncbi:MAG: TIGR00730 family Rossman fold protein [Bacteroidota bacterium]